MLNKKPLVGFPARALRSLTSSHPTWELASSGSHLADQRALFMFVSRFCDACMSVPE